MKRLSMFLFLFVGILIFGGCAKTFQVIYQPEIALSVPKMEKQHKVVVIKFEDIRGRVRPKKESSYKEFGKYGIWSLNFDREIATIVLDVLAEELTKANFVVTKREELLIEAVPNKVMRIGETEQVEFVLDGKISSFDLEYETGLLTATPLRAVILSVSLLDAKTGKTIMSNTFSDRSEEGGTLFTLHSTQAKKLVNIHLPKVIEKIILAIQEQIKEE